MFFILHSWEFWHHMDDTDPTNCPQNPPSTSFHSLSVFFVCFYNVLFFFIRLWRSNNLVSTSNKQRLSTKSFHKRYTVGSAPDTRRAGKCCRGFISLKEKHTNSLKTAQRQTRGGTDFGLSVQVNFLHVCFVRRQCAQGWVSALIWNCVRVEQCKHMHDVEKRWEVVWG